MTLKGEQDGKPRPLLPDFSDEESDEDEDDKSSARSKKKYT